jgi:hypothetical protein
MTTLAACGSAPKGQAGILSLAWTVKHLPPTPATCAGVDHLDLLLTPQNGFNAVEISPIDCALDRFRYDHLPLGPASVQVTGYDAGGVILLQGATQVDLTSDAPATAAPLDLE